MSVSVFAPPTAALPTLPADVKVVRFGTAHELVAALRGPENIVLVSDGLRGGDAVAHAIRTAGVTVIQVQSEKWDGEEHSALTAACKGVIAGFGLSAVAYAISAFD